LGAARTAATARLAFDGLRPVMRRLVALEVLPVNPCNGLPLPRDDERPLRFLTPGEGDRLRAAAEADRHYGVGAFVDLGLATGARRGELLGLRWSDVDWEGRALAIAGSWSLRTGAMGPTKSGKPRTVPVGREVLGRLREYRLRTGRAGAGERVLPFDPRKPYARAVAAAGLAEPAPTIHSLRHSTATWWLAAGLTVHEVADLLGHETPALVIRRYGHALPRQVATAGERLERFLAADAVAR
jgi:integrase